MFLNRVYVRDKRKQFYYDLYMVYVYCLHKSIAKTTPLPWTFDFEWSFDWQFVASGVWPCSALCSASWILSVTLHLQYTGVSARAEESATTVKTAVHFSFHPRQLLLFLLSPYIHLARFFRGFTTFFVAGIILEVKTKTVSIGNSNGNSNGSTLTLQSRLQ